MRSPAAIGVTRVGDGRLGTHGAAARRRARSSSATSAATSRSSTRPRGRRTARSRTGRSRRTSDSSCSALTASRLAVGGPGMIELLDGRTFARASRSSSVPGPDMQFINVAFSPDGRVLVAMYADLARRRAGHERGPAALRRAHRPAPRPRRSRSAEPGCAGRLSPRSARTGGGWSPPRATHGAWSPAPTPAPVVRGRAIVVRDPRTLRPLRSFRASRCAGALSPDGRTFAAGGDDGSVRFLDLRTASSGPRRDGTRPRSTGRAVHADGRFLVTAGEDANAIVWDVRRPRWPRRSRATPAASSGWPSTGAAHTLYTAAADGTVITWDLAGDRRLGRPFDAGGRPVDRFLATAVSRDGRTLAMQRGRTAP